MMADESRSSFVARDAQPQPREIVIDHVPWRVYELASAFDRRATPSLIFESEDVVRRVRNYPVDWRRLSDAELFALSWRS